MMNEKLELARNIINDTTGYKTKVVCINKNGFDEIYVHNVIKYDQSRKSLAPDTAKCQESNKPTINDMDFDFDDIDIPDTTSAEDVINTSDDDLEADENIDDVDNDEDYCDDSNYNDFENDYDPID